MRFSDGVNKYHNDKKESILNSVLNSAQPLPSNEKDREGIIMSTNKSNTGAAMVKSSKSGIIAAACAILMIGAVTFFATRNNDGSTDIKTSPGAQPIASSVTDDNSKPNDSSETSAPDAPIVDDGAYPTASPAAVIAPDDRGTIESGFEGYNIEVKYLIEDLREAQHSYGIVVDVTAGEGYQLPWADEEAKQFSHLDEVWIDNGHTDSSGYFESIKANKVDTYGYKTQNEEGEDVLRFLLLAEVDEGYKPDKDTEVSFNVNVVFWGVGDPFKTEGRFTASVTFDEARTLDLALTIPCQDVSAE